VSGAVLAKPLPVIHNRSVVRVALEYNSHDSTAGYRASSETLAEDFSRALSPTMSTGQVEDDALSETPGEEVPYIPKGGFSGFKMSRVTRRNGFPVNFDQPGHRNREAGLFLLQADQQAQMENNLKLLADSTTVQGGGVGTVQANEDGAVMEAIRRKSLQGSRPVSRLGSRLESGQSTGLPRQRRRAPVHRPMSRDNLSYVGDSLEQVIARERQATVFSSEGITAKNFNSDIAPAFDQRKLPAADEPYLRFLQQRRQGTLLSTPRGRRGTGQRQLSRTARRGSRKGQRGMDPGDAPEALAQIALEGANAAVLQPQLFYEIGEQTETADASEGGT